MALSPKMYIVVRKDLDMPPGKMAAQVGHAVGRLLLWHTSEWSMHRGDILDQYFDVTKGNEAKVVLGCQDEKELMELKDLASTHKIPITVVKDAAHTVFKEPTVTCLGIGPVTVEEEVYFKHLKLY